MANIQRFHVSNRYCEVAIHNNVAYFAGQVPENSENGTAFEQTQDVLNLIDHLLAEIGSHKSQILSAQIFLADMQDYAEMNRAWDAWVDSSHPPCRACVEAKLALPKWKVEIVITAAVG
ncbi:enamine deaminase RidA (YjgF/YER057c/UK114 family) [Pasteurella langaaensis DSM 22999]|uniref:Enamine deaminase RidA (YjgF/YER057c/UK114 family) n=1 Tax=Alitibacter langaaensis DSM 22999 TaxID=1122935 RepID=A0A2U0SKU0_9PAST|nr:RidA family protein [Pasteurella langaaensis]PVX31958.1 enamine deaminase RidA (YjgF/YER057c/UK114 family) [Pasteurella langaaensis DSM 22999]